MSVLYEIIKEDGCASHGRGRIIDVVGVDMTIQDDKTKTLFTARMRDIKIWPI